MVLVNDELIILFTLLFSFSCNGKLGVNGIFFKPKENFIFQSYSLITYHETYLLVDAHNTTQETKQEVAIIVAHELAHQWFGNLVVSHFYSL